MAIETPRHAEFACDEIHPGATHNDWIALELKTGGTDNSGEAAFIGKITLPEPDDAAPECDHNGATLIKMDGVPKYDEGYACGRCGQRFVAMNSGGRFHRVRLIYRGKKTQDDPHDRVIPRALLLDGLELKGVTDMRFEANLQGDARKVWLRLIVNSFDEITEPEEAPDADRPQ